MLNFREVLSFRFSWWKNLLKKVPILDHRAVVLPFLASSSGRWSFWRLHPFSTEPWFWENGYIIGKMDENGGTLGIVPLIINPIYTPVYSGYLLGISQGYHHFPCEKRLGFPNKHPRRLQLWVSFETLRFFNEKGGSQQKSGEFYLGYFKRHCSIVDLCSENKNQEKRVEKLSCLFAGWFLKDSSKYENPIVHQPTCLQKKWDLRSVYFLPFSIFDVKISLVGFSQTQPVRFLGLHSPLRIDLPGKNQIEVGVHIADVGHFLKLGTVTDAEAQRRTTSVYLIGRVLPMLPHGLCNHLCSLNPNEPKLSFSAFFRLCKKTGNLIQDPAPWFAKTAMCSVCRLNYDQAQDIIDDIEIDEDKRPAVHSGFTWQQIKDDIKLLYDVCGKVRMGRLTGGALTINKTKMNLFHGWFNWFWVKNICYIPEN